MQGGLPDTARKILNLLHEQLQDCLASSVAAAQAMPLVESGATRVPIDCGFGPWMPGLAARPGANRPVWPHWSPRRADHAGGLSLARRARGLPVWPTYGTLQAGAAHAAGESTCG